MKLPISRSSCPVRSEKKFQVAFELEASWIPKSSGCGGENRFCLCRVSKRQIFKPRYRWQNNIKMDMTERWVKAWDVFVRRTVVKRSKNLQVQWKLKYLNSWKIIVLLRNRLYDIGRKLYVSVSCFLKFLESGHKSYGYWQSFVWIL